MAQRCPEATLQLSSPQGEEAIRRWEAEHGLVPVLVALERAAKTVKASWEAGVPPRRAVVRALAVLGISPAVPGADDLRKGVTEALGEQRADTALLVDHYAGAVVAEREEAIERVDGRPCQSLPSDTP